MNNIYQFTAYPIYSIALTTTVNTKVRIKKDVVYSVLHQSTLSLLQMDIKSYMVMWL